MAPSTACDSGVEVFANNFAPQLAAKTYQGVATSPSAAAIPIKTFRNLTWRRGDAASIDAHFHQVADDSLANHAVACSSGQSDERWNYGGVCRLGGCSFQEASTPVAAATPDETSRPLASSNARKSDVKVFDEIFVPQQPLVAKTYQGVATSPSAATRGDAATDAFVSPFVADDSLADHVVVGPPNRPVAPPDQAAAPAHQADGSRLILSPKGGLDAKRVVHVWRHI